MSRRQPWIEKTPVHLATSGQGGGSARRLKQRLAKENWDTAPGFKFRPGFIYTQVRAISARINQNYDGWPADELKKSYKTFIGKPCFVNHENEYPDEARGVVVAARFVDGAHDSFIEVIQEIDAKRFPKLAHEIRTGGLDSVSMGAEAAFTICSYCKHKAHDEDDMCDHVKFHKGEKLRKFNRRTGKTDEILVYEKCMKLSFFELSYVFDPADETAVASKVLVANKKDADVERFKRMVREKYPKRDPADIQAVGPEWMERGGDESRFESAVLKAAGYKTADECPPGQDCNASSRRDPAAWAGSATGTPAAPAAAGTPSTPSTPSVAGGTPTGGGGVPLVQKPDGSWTSSDPAWAHLIDRESGGQNIKQSPSTQDVNSGGNEAFGLFQITPGTWSAHGGQGSVYNSTPEQQAQVAADIIRKNPSGSDWGAGMAGRENASALASGLSATTPKAASFEAAVLKAAGYKVAGPSDDYQEWKQKVESGEIEPEKGPKQYGPVKNKALSDWAAWTRKRGTVKEREKLNSYERQVLRVAYGETEAPPQVETLREEGSAPEDDNDDFHRYVEPPDELQTPDLSAAGNIDREQDESQQQGVGDMSANPEDNPADAQQYMVLKIPMPGQMAPPAMPPQMPGQPPGGQMPPQQQPQIPMQAYASKTFEARVLEVAGITDNGMSWDESSKHIDEALAKGESNNWWSQGDNPRNRTSLPPGHRFVQFADEAHDNEPPRYFQGVPETGPKGNEVWHVRGADDWRYDPDELIFHDSLPPDAQLDELGIWNTGQAHGHEGWDPDKSQDPFDPRLHGASVRVPRTTVAYFDRYFGVRTAKDDDKDNPPIPATPRRAPAPGTTFTQDPNDPNAHVTPVTGDPQGVGVSRLTAPGAPPPDRAPGPGTLPNEATFKTLSDQAGLPPAPGGKAPLENWQLPGGTNPTDPHGLAMPFAQSQVGQFAPTLNRAVGNEDVTNQANQGRIDAWNKANPTNVFDPEMKYDPSTMERGVQHTFTKPGPPGAGPAPGTPPAAGAPPGPSPFGALSASPPGGEMQRGLQQGEAGGAPPAPAADAVPTLNQPPAGGADAAAGVSKPPGPPKEGSLQAYFNNYFGTNVEHATLQNGREVSGNSRKRKGSPMSRSSTLAQRGKVASRGRRQHFAEGPYTDGGPYGRNDEGEQEEAFVVDVPPAEPVETADDGRPISNTEDNLVARVQRGRVQLLRDAQQLAAFKAGKQAGRRQGSQRRTAESLENAESYDPQVDTGPAGEELTGDHFEAIGERPVETQPRDASLHAFKVFDNWLHQATGRQARDLTEVGIKRAAAEFAKRANIDVRGMFPALGIVLRQARKNETAIKKGARMRRYADEKLEVAAPDGRIDVEAPVTDETDAEAQASQFDLHDFGDNAGDNVAKPDLETDSQFWAPGEGDKKESRRKPARAGGILAVRCAEAYIDAGLEPNTKERKYQLAGMFENMNRGTVQRDIALLERLSAVQSQQRRKVASGRTRGAASPLPPGLAGGGTRRAASVRRMSANDPINDALLYG